MDALIPFTTSGSLVDIVDSELRSTNHVNTMYSSMTTSREGPDSVTRWKEIDRRVAKL